VFGEKASYKIMAKEQFSQHLRYLTLALTIELLAAPLVTIAQTTPINPTTTSPWEIGTSSAYDPPPDTGSPGRRESGGNRPGEIASQLKCPTDTQVPNPPLTALVPKVKEEILNSPRNPRSKIIQLMGLTVEPHPTFFVYIPKTEAKTAEFILNDADEKEVYRTSLTIPESSGIFSFKLPENIPPLAVGKSYQWYYVIRCDPTNRKRDLEVEGWILRTGLRSPINEQIQTATLRDRLALYRQHKIWYEALTTLASLRSANPKNSQIAKEWKEFLDSAGLGEISDKALNNQ